MPVYMNVDGRTHSAPEFRDLLIKQATHPVRWVDTIRNMHADGIDTFIECGAGRTLSGLIKKTLKGVTILRVENAATLEKTLQALGAK